MTLPRAQKAVFCFLLLMFATSEASSSPTSKMPSLFRNDDIIYDRYAACLAATEDLRRKRDRTIAQLVNEKNNKQLIGRLDAEYTKDATKIVEGLGMSLDQFNKIGQSVISNTVLKRKVVSQAYLYRVESAVNMDRIPIDDPAAAFPEIAAEDEKLKNFCQSMLQIETLRQVQLEKLRANSNLGSIAPGALMAVLPLTRPRVRQFISDFPVMAEEIVKQNGLDPMEFNAMLWQAKKNPKMQSKVKRIMNGIN